MTSLKPTCPSCKQKIARRRRVNGELCCPHCGGAVFVVGKFFSTEKRPSLSVELWQHFLDCVARQQGHRMVVLENDAAYYRELGVAIFLIKKCGGDIDLAIEAVTQLFELKAIRWKTRTSLVHCAGPDFRLALAAARKVVARQRDEEAIIVRSMASTAIAVPMPSF